MLRGVSAALAALTLAAQAYTEYRFELVTCGCTFEQPLFEWFEGYTTVDATRSVVSQSIACESVLRSYSLYSYRVSAVNSDYIYYSTKALRKLSSCQPAGHPLVRRKDVASNSWIRFSAMVFGIGCYFVFAVAKRHYILEALNRLLLKGKI